MLTPDSKSHTTPGRGGRLDALALLLVTAVVAWPIAAVQWIPFVDYPQHLGTIAVMHDADSPLFAPYYEVVPGKTQYLLVYWLGELFASFLSIEAAGRMVAICCVALLPASVAIWLRENDRPMLLGALTGACAVHAYVMWGFLNFTLGVSMSLLALAATARLLRRPNAVNTALLAATGLLAFYAHPMTCAWFGVAALVHALDAWWRTSWRELLRPLLHCVAAALPMLVATAFWLANSTILEEGVAIARNGTAANVADEAPVWLPVLETLARWKMQSFGTWTDGAGDRIGYAFLTACAALWAARLAQWLRPAAAADAGARARRSWAPECTLALTVLVYLWAPFSYRMIGPINWRFLPVAFALLPAIGPRALRLPLLRLSAAALGVGLAVFASSTHATRFQVTDDEMGDLRAALARAEPGRRLLGLTFAPQSGATGLPLYMHTHQYYQALRGGLACFSFAEFPMSPLDFRPETMPPPFPPSIEWNSALYDHSVHGDSFDYWLVRALPPGHDPFAKPAPSGAPAPKKLFENDTWTLFGRDG